MSVYCQNCGAELLDSANFCPQCGASITGAQSGTSDAARTAATVGGVVLGAAALESLAFRMSHRRRPMYGAPPPPPPRRPPMRGPGGFGGGPGGFGGPGGRGGGRR